MGWRPGIRGREFARLGDRGFISGRCFHGLFITLDGDKGAAVLIHGAGLAAIMVGVTELGLRAATALLDCPGHFGAGKGRPSRNNQAQNQKA